MKFALIILNHCGDFNFCLTAILNVALSCITLWWIYPYFWRQSGEFTPTILRVLTLSHVGIKRIYPLILKLSGEINLKIPISESWRLENEVTCFQIAKIRKWVRDKFFVCTKYKDIKVFKFNRLHVNSTRSCTVFDRRIYLILPFLKNRLSKDHHN